ncbi:MAG: hypothetical protein AAB613_02640 [Patescibacteria group bacterium]
MVISGRFWSFWLKPILWRLTWVDWLSTIILIIFLGTGFAVVGVLGKELIVGHDFLAFLLVVAILIGFLYRPRLRFDYAEAISASTWPVIFRTLALSSFLIGLPILAIFQTESISSNSVWLRVISVLLIVNSVTMFGNLCSHLRKRYGIPLLLAFVWWLLFIESKITSTLAAGLATSDLNTQIYVLLISVGLIGVTTVLVELTSPYYRQVQNEFVAKIWSFDHPMPSFTGMGSLLIVNLLRIVRDKVFLIYMGSFLVLLLSRILIDGWMVNWLVVVIVSLGGLSTLITTRLIQFSRSFAVNFSHLPISPGAREFVGFFAGVVLISALSWIIIWGLFGVSAENMAQLIIACLSGFGVSYLLGLSGRKIENIGLSGPSWQILFQLIVFWLIFLYSLQLPLSNATFSLLIIMLLTVLVACYPVTRASVTIR